MSRIECGSKNIPGVRQLRDRTNRQSFLCCEFAKRLQPNWKQTNIGPIENFNIVRRTTVLGSDRDDLTGDQFVNGINLYFDGVANLVFILHALRHKHLDRQG